ncbi:hypothetical protein I6N95_03195 [Vagococcus sp. BWB3-3]|uniref:Uncharacterized protein n=1 Tax=Vagococcus allomyrinae TaxID=2794353 RepID=A0A940PAS9_9ENTE|nr:hypothetical protein [Vagococcus allomyrinae]MBP1040011.1 hypothetical protein [Vagococcus allomyrinae]
MQWNVVISFAVVSGIMFIGDFLSNKSKGKIPQMLVVAIIFLVGYWTILPEDIIQVSGISVMNEIVLSFILIHVGTMFDFKSMLKEWRVVVTTLAASAGIILFTLVAGWLIFDKLTALVAMSPMTGGGMAAIIMNTAAQEIGRADLGMLAMLIFIMHGFIGFPLAAHFIKKECMQLVTDFRGGKLQALEEAEVKGDQKVTLIQRIPEKYRTTTFYLAQLALLGAICGEISRVTSINFAIVQIVVGIICTQVGILEANPVNKTDSYGILSMALFANFMASFTLATFDVVANLFVKIIVLMVIATIGLVLFSVPVGKKMGYSKNMSIAIGINCFLGFPFNFAITNEAIKTVADNEEEAVVLNQQMMSKMIIAGIVAVSFVSAILAGIVASVAF